MWQLFSATWVVASRAIEILRRDFAGSRDLDLPENEQVAFLRMASSSLYRVWNFSAVFLKPRSNLLKR
jgi:hypothetical protein